MDRRFVLRALSLVLLFLSLPGCATFSSQWRKAQKSEWREGVEGPWEGTWKSETTGHSGKLRCVVTPVSSETYRARFQAKFASVFSFTYNASFQVVPENDKYLLTGTTKLPGWAGGTYQHRGEVTTNRFYSRYKAKEDTGFFEMKRPQSIQRKPRMDADKTSKKPAI